MRKFRSNFSMELSISLCKFPVLVVVKFFLFFAALSLENQGHRQDVDRRVRMRNVRMMREFFNNSYQTFIVSEETTKKKNMNSEFQMKYLKIIYQVSLQNQHLFMQSREKIWHGKSSLKNWKVQSAIKRHLISSSSFINRQEIKELRTFKLITSLSFSLFLPVLPNTRTLRVSKIIVPQFIDVRNIASLECIYEIGNNRKLNSVKWYKNDKEFFRWALRVLQFYMMNCVLLLLVTTTMRDGISICMKRVAIMQMDRRST